MECCGVTVRTPFCPHCGKCFVEEPRVKFLAHMRRCVKKAGHEVVAEEGWLREVLASGKSSANGQRGLDNAIARQKKWSEWLCLVEEAFLQQDRDNTDEEAANS